jgi:hypothetical protein
MSTELLERADIIDGRVRARLARLDLTRTDSEHQRTIDALMGASLAADALRALARGDLTETHEATASMAYYAQKAFS